ncbi:MAG: RNA polymerase sigma factor [Lachnospiraceae bacterium]|nr:RNA polymerase sigma factor [Lachnospiraceae bacterium]
MDNGASSYRRFLDGDEGGIVSIIRDYKDGLILYLNGFVQNIHTAEDLMEDTFVRLVVKKPKFSARYSFKTWLYTIGRNVAIDYLRRNVRMLPVSHEDLQKVECEEAGLEASYLKEEQKILLHRAMRKLKSEYRQVLYLSFFEDFDNAQIAAVMKKSKRQVENLIYRAKMSLKSELDKEGFVYERL